MDDDQRLRDAVDFILHAANERALRIVRRALKRRTAPPDVDQAPAATSTEGLTLEMSQRVARQLASAADAGTMARNVVRQLILQNEPDMPAEHLEVLLDAWAPRQGSAEQGAGAEQALPAGALLTMITQFVSYSLGIMPPHEQRQLPDGWSARYWSAFSAHTQRLIKQLLTGDREAADFWRAIREHVGPIEAADG